MERDFCILEKTDCSSKPETSENNPKPTNLECPDVSKNKQCGEFKWAEIKWDEEGGMKRQACVAMDTSGDNLWIPKQSALHDRNSCGDYGATRVWFRKSNADEMFKALTTQLSQGKNYCLIVMVDIK